mgnify:CR=1 FL=1
MKIIVISNKNTEPYEDLYTPLSYEGFNAADKLLDDKLLQSVAIKGIDTIYSAPSICCLQTIYPFCERHNLNVCIENAFYKKLDSLHFNFYNFRYTINDIENHIPYLGKIIDDNYSSSISTSNISFCDDESGFNNRITAFLYSLVKESKNNDKTYIINTHKCVSDKIKNIVTNKLNENIYKHTNIHFL